MRFKVFFVSEKEKLKKDKLNLLADDRESVIDYNYEDNFHCFKILKNHSIKEKGIEKEDHEFINSTEFFEKNSAKRLVSMGYVFINTANGNIYTYKCDNNKVKRLFMRYFMLSNIDTKVDIDKLKLITKIEIKLKNNPQLDLLSENIPLECNLTDELSIHDKEIKTFTAKYEFIKGGTVFSKPKLQKVLEKYKNITIEGLDEHDNILQINESVQLCVDLDVDYSEFQELRDISFRYFLDKIKDKEMSALYDY